MLAVRHAGRGSTLHSWPWLSWPCSPGRKPRSRLAGGASARYRGPGPIEPAHRSVPFPVFSAVLFLKAVLAGFVVAVPIGAIGAMCLRRALQGRWVVGLLTGAGAAIADMILATGALYGLSLLRHHLLENHRPVLLVGGVFLIFIGVRMIHKRRPKLDSRVPSANDQLRRWRVLSAALTTGFALTLINPATLIAFMGVFAGLGLIPDEPHRLLEGWLVIAGVFTGSMLWWMTLTGTALAVRRHLPLEVVVGLNVTLGVLVVGFGVASLLSLLGLDI